MKSGITLLALLLVGIAVGALAVPAGRFLEFTDSPQGKVTFSGQVHKDAGFTCSTCHKPDLFPQKKKGTVKITMNDIYAGKFCGACHNGKPAFAAKENCGRCHKK